MELILFLFLAGLTVFLSFRLSYYADLLNKTTNISGVFIGGILLGIIEILGRAYISSQLSDAIVFAVLIIVLLVRPTGILGKKIHEKV